jgi:hypothetical protein
MIANINFKERVIRFVGGVIIASLFIYQDSVWAILGLIPILTGAIGFSPLYYLTGFNNNKHA